MKAALLKALREDKQLTQKELGVKAFPELDADSARTMIARYERGLRPIPRWRVETLKKALK